MQTAAWRALHGDYDRAYKQANPLAFARYHEKQAEKYRRRAAEQADMYHKPVPHSPDN